MRCRAEIQLGTVNDAVSVPIQSIFREGPLAYVYVPESGGWSQREVVLGRASELAVEVVNGVDVGDIVLLREPDTVEVVSRISNERLEGGPSMPRGAGGKPQGVGGRPAGAGGKPQAPSGVGAGQGYKGARGDTSSSGESKGKPDTGEKTVATDAPAPKGPATEETP